MGNDSWTRELAYTARIFGPEEALNRGYVSKVTEDATSCLNEAIALAVMIASKSPVAITTSKMSINYSRDHSV